MTTIFDPDQGSAAERPPGAIDPGQQALFTALKAEIDENQRLIERLLRSIRWAIVINAAVTVYVAWRLWRGLVAVLE